MGEERYYKATITRRDIRGIRIETAWAWEGAKKVRAWMVKDGFEKGALEE